MVSYLVFTYSMLESDYNVMLIEIYLGRIYIIDIYCLTCSSLIVHEKVEFC